MIDPKPLRFGEGWADTVFARAPLAEVVLRAFVGRCQACGCRPERQREGSVLVNALVVAGTLYGDTFCAQCFDREADDPVFMLPPLD